MSKPITIGIDGNEANVAQRVGSNVYAHQLLCGLEQLTRSKAEYQFEVMLMSVPLADMPAERVGWHYTVVKPRRLWTQWALPLYLFQHRKQLDVFFTPGHYAPSLCPIPYVSSVMDLAFLSEPETFRWQDRFQLKHFTKRSVNNAAAIVVISEATKRAVQTAYGRNAKEITIAYPGAPIVQSVSKSRQKAILEAHELDSPFFLYVGTIQPRKNIPVLIKAFEQLVTRFQTERLPRGIDPTRLPQLVLVGKTGWLADPSMAAITQSSVAALVNRIGFADSETQATLYTNAVATLLLSRGEGFGMPPLEAMAYGSIPIVSDSTSLPEVVGKAGFVVPLDDVEATTSAMWDSLLLSAKQRASQRKLAREQVTQFSWLVSAGAVLKTLVTVARKQP